MTHRWVPGKHLGLSGEFRYRGSSTASSGLGYGGLSTASTDLGYGGSLTVATSTHSSSHLVEHYQKMSMHPLAEGKLRYARTDYHGLLTLLSACAGPSLSQTKLSSEDVEEESKHQGSKVSNATIHPLIISHHPPDVTCPPSPQSCRSPLSLPKESLTLMKNQTQPQ